MFIIHYVLEAYNVVKNSSFNFGHMYSIENQYFWNELAWIIFPRRFEAHQLWIQTVPYEFFLSFAGPGIGRAMIAKCWSKSTIGQEENNQVDGDFCKSRLYPSLTSTLEWLFVIIRFYGLGRSTDTSWTIVKAAKKVSAYLFKCVLTLCSK